LASLNLAGNLVPRKYPQVGSLVPMGEVQANVSIQANWTPPLVK